MYQKLTLIGNLGRNPEMRYLPSGTAVCDFSVATNRTYYKDEEKVTETTWFKVTVWGNRAENCNQYLRKGSKVMVEGRLQPEVNTWTKSDGSIGASYDMTASEVIFLSSKGENSGYNSEEDFPATPKQTEVPW